MYDGLTLASYLSRWRPFLVGSKVIGVVMLDAVDRQTNVKLEDELRRGAVVAFSISRGGEERELVFVNPGVRSGLFLWGKAGLRRTNPKSRQKKQEAGFLRRRLAGAKITEIHQLGHDRILRLDLTGTDELGEAVTLNIHLLLTGRRANLVLEVAGKVAYAWRSGPPYGQPFQPPKGGVATVTEYLDGRREGLITPKRKRALAGELIAGVDGISSTAVNEIFHRLNLAPKATYTQLDGATLDRLAVTGDELIASAAGVGYYPENRIISALPLSGLGVSRPVAEEDETGLVAFYEWEYHRGALVARLGKELNRISGRRRKAMRDKRDVLEKVAGADDLQLAGQMLLASPNVKEAAPVSINLPDGSIISLDPDISRLANAQRLFERAKRNRRARNHAGMLNELSASLDAEYAELTAAMAPDTPLEKVGELYARYVEAEKPTAKGGLALPAKVSRKGLPGGFILFWGRDGRANQYVTFRLARPGDIWFHVQQGSGAHVIVRRPHRDASLPHGVVEEAARLALKHSAMRTAAHVPIVYTERRYVRHRRGAPGAVFYEREKVIYLDGARK